MDIKRMKTLAGLTEGYRAFDEDEQQQPQPSMVVQIDLYTNRPTPVNVGDYMSSLEEIKQDYELIKGDDGVYVYHSEEYMFIVFP